LSNRDKTGHPDLLPWLITGRLDAADARQVEDHVGRCEECTEVAASLTSMSRSLRAAALEHIGVEELIDWEAGQIRGDADRSARIEAHLSVCAACADDLALLRRTGSRASTARPFRWWLVAAAAAIALGVSLTVVSSLRRSPEPGSIVLLPATRSGDSSPTIDRTRPWTIACVLPFSAPAGEYQIRIEREDGSLLRRLEGTFGPEADGRISLLLEPIEQPGSYNLVLESMEAPPGTSYSYGFRVQP
jgi:hypothetical protein